MSNWVVYTLCGIREDTIYAVRFLSVRNVVAFVFFFFFFSFFFFLLLLLTSPSYFFFSVVVVVVVSSTFLFLFSFYTLWQLATRRYTDPDMCKDTANSSKVTD